MILHTLNSKPGSSGFEDCRRFASADDAILLMGDGVYAALSETDAWQQLLDTGSAIHVLEADARAAGIMARLPAQAIVEGFDGFVTLTERFPRQMAWY